MQDSDKIIDARMFWMKVVSLSFDLEHHLQRNDMYVKSSFVDDIALRIVVNIMKQDVSWFERRWIDAHVAIWKLKCNIHWYQMRMSWKLTSLREVL